MELRVFSPRFRMENNDPIMRPEAQHVSMHVCYSSYRAQRWIKAENIHFWEHPSTIQRKRFDRLSKQPCQSDTERPALFVSGCWSLILFFLKFIIRMVLSSAALELQLKTFATRVSLIALLTNSLPSVTCRLWIFADGVSVDLLHKWKRWFNLLFKTGYKCNING